MFEFLETLQTTGRHKLLIIWDRLQPYRSKMVRELIEARRGAIAQEYSSA